MKRGIGNFLLVCASVGLALGLALGVDWSAGRLMTDPVLTAGLLFPPNVSAYYEASEYTFTAEINNIGIRDNDTTLKKKHAVRVLAIGDSYTYGWGVPIEDAWVKVLEKNLRDRGHDVEVLNLGAPGFHPANYADTAERAIPLLDPDLVIIGLLPSDDLIQAKRAFGPNKNWKKTDTPLVARMTRRFFPNLRALASKERADREAALAGASNFRWRLLTVRKTWRDGVHRILNSMVEEEKVKFNRLDQGIQQDFRDGLLSPLRLSVVLGRIRFSPKDFEMPIDSPEFRLRIMATTHELERIRKVGLDHGVDVLVLLVPEAQYISREVFFTSRKMGTTVRKEEELHTMIFDETAMEALKRARLDGISVTEAMREYALETAMYYPVNTHMNVAGNKVFADLVTPFVEQRLFGKPTEQSTGN